MEEFAELALAPTGVGAQPKRRAAMAPPWSGSCEGGCPEGRGSPSRCGIGFCFQAHPRRYLQVLLSRAGFPNYCPQSSAASFSQALALLACWATALSETPNAASFSQALTPFSLCVAFVLQVAPVQLSQGLSVVAGHWSALANGNRWLPGIRLPHVSRSHFAIHLSIASKCPACSIRGLGA